MDALHQSWKVNSFENLQWRHQIYVQPHVVLQQIPLYADGAIGEYSQAAMTRLAMRLDPQRRSGCTKEETAFRRAK